MIPPIVTPRRLYLAGAALAGVVALYGAVQWRLAAEHADGAAAARAEIHQHAVDQITRAAEGRRAVERADDAWKFECVFRAGDCRAVRMLDASNP